MTELPTNGLVPTEPAPRTRDPIRLASVTVKAVDQIGEAAAAEIEDAAAQLEAAAAEIGTKLRSLAKAVRDHSRIAGEHVEGFCNRSTAVIETVRAMQARLDGGGDDERG